MEGMDDDGPVPLATGAVVQQGRHPAERARLGRMGMNDLRLSRKHQAHQPDESPEVAGQANAPAEILNRVRGEAIGEAFEAALLRAGCAVNQQGVVASRARPRSRIVTCRAGPPTLSLAMIRMTRMGVDIRRERQTVIRIA